MDGCTKLPRELPCSADAFCESPAADLARARETGHECSCCVTIADTVSVPDNHAEMQSGAHDVSHTRKWSQIHAYTAPDAVSGAVCALECVALWLEGP